MKKSLLATALLVCLSSMTLTADAFCWSNLNPSNWGSCNKSEKVASCNCKKHHKPSCEKKDKCHIEQKKESCSQEETSSSCGSCEENSSCDPCDRLQQETEK
jgi:hypothetical protein